MMEEPNAGDFAATEGSRCCHTAVSRRHLPPVGAELAPQGVAAEKRYGVAMPRSGPGARENRVVIGLRAAAFEGLYEGRGKARRTELWEKSIG